MFKMVNLNYAFTDIDPYVSEESFKFHYGKHYQNYVNKTNEIVAGSVWEEKILKDIISLTKDPVLFNNAAQIWNHEFFWNSMTPPSDKKPYGQVSELILKKYSTYQNFYDEFYKKSLSHFGSGWAWLVCNKNSELDIYTTSNAENPLAKGDNALITLDLWEHSYYLDYKNNRALYIENFLKYLINWKFANKNLAR